MITYTGLPPEGREKYNELCGAVEHTIDVIELGSLGPEERQFLLVNYFSKQELYDAWRGAIVERLKGKA